MGGKFAHHALNDSVVAAGLSCGYNAADSRFSCQVKNGRTERENKHSS